MDQQGQTTPLSLAEQHKEALEALGRKMLDPVVYVAWYAAGADCTPLVRTGGNEPDMTMPIEYTNLNAPACCELEKNMYPRPDDHTKGLMRVGLCNSFTSACAPGAPAPLRDLASILTEHQDMKPAV